MGADQASYVNLHKTMVDGLFFMQHLIMHII